MVLLLFFFFFAAFIQESWNPFQLSHDFRVLVLFRQSVPCLLWPLRGLDLEGKLFTVGEGGAYTHTFLAQACSLRVCGTGKTWGKSFCVSLFYPSLPAVFAEKETFSVLCANLDAVLWLGCPDRRHMVCGKWLSKCPPVRVRVQKGVLWNDSTSDTTGSTYSTSWLLDMAAWQPVVNAARLSHCHSSLLCGCCFFFLPPHQSVMVEKNENLHLGYSASGLNEGAVLVLPSSLPHQWDVIVCRYRNWGTRKL